MPVFFFNDKYSEVNFINKSSVLVSNNSQLSLVKKSESSEDYRYYYWDYVQAKLLYNYLFDRRGIDIQLNLGNDQVLSENFIFPLESDKSVYYLSKIVNDETTLARVDIETDTRILIDQRKINYNNYINNIKFAVNGDPIEGGSGEVAISYIDYSQQPHRLMMRRFSKTGTYRGFYVSNWSTMSTSSTLAFMTYDCYNNLYIGISGGTSLVKDCIIIITPDEEATEFLYDIGKLPIPVMSGIQDNGLVWYFNSSNFRLPVDLYPSLQVSEANGWNYNYNLGISPLYSCLDYDGNLVGTIQTILKIANKDTGAIDSITLSPMITNPYLLPNKDLWLVNRDRAASSLIYKYETKSLVEIKGVSSRDAKIGYSPVIRPQDYL